MSKASHSDELVARINHADIDCEFAMDHQESFPLMINRRNDYLKEELCPLIKGIGDYLTRVVGSVPIDLKITLRIYDEITSIYPRLTSGPWYYEGQGQAMSELQF